MSTWVVGYARVSSEQQGDSGLGLEAQESAIGVECVRRGWELVEVVVDVAGAGSLSRPGLERVLLMLASGGVSGVVVSRLDRLTRSVVDLGGLLERAKGEGWNVVALDFGLDLQSPQGELVANVLVAVGQWERRMVGVRTREALGACRARGVRLGRPSVYSDEVARKAQGLRAAGASLWEVCRQLEVLGVATANGGRWRPSSLGALLRRDVGEVGPFVVDGPGVRPSPEDELVHGEIRDDLYG